MPWNWQWWCVKQHIKNYARVWVWLFVLRKGVKWTQKLRS